MKSFEVGIVYRKGHQMFLAVSPTTLITFRRRKIVEIRPHSIYDSVRSISVESLCEAWGISLEDMDRMTTKYLPPPQDSIKPSARGAKRSKESSELLWRSLRSGKISVP